MASYSGPAAKPPTFNVADGATAGTLLMGTGPDTAGWGELRLTGDMSAGPGSGAGDDAGAAALNVLSSLARALPPEATKGLTKWDKSPGAGLTPDGIIRPQITSAGWWILYSGRGWSRSPWRAGRMMPAEFGSAEMLAIFDPAGTGNPGSLEYHTGAPQLYPDHYIYRTLWFDRDNRPQSGTGGLTPYTPNNGQRFILGAYDSALRGWSFRGFSIGYRDPQGTFVETERTYQP